MSQAPSPPPPSPGGETTPRPGSLRLLWDRWGYSLLPAAYFGILGFLLMAVVPKFGEMLEEMTQFEYLPRMTAALIRCGQCIRHWWFLYVPVVIGLSLLVARVPPRRRPMLEIVLICTMAAVTGFVVYALFLPRIHMTGASE